ncbi:WD40 repeat-like protein [Mycena floridula]|nr:WD40 repeat-like protein [Mycena floridula]
MASSSPSSSSHNPRFTRRLTTAFGSPFVKSENSSPAGPGSSFRNTTSYARAASEPPCLSGLTESTSRPQTPPPRSDSPSPSTAGFSIIGQDEAEASFHYLAQNTPYKTFGSLGRRGAVHSTPTLNYFSSNTSNTPNSNIKSFLPRLWDVIASPSKNTRNPRPSATTSSNSRHTMYNYSSLSSPMKKSREKSAYKTDIFANGEYGGHVEYISVPPLDDDEGELIDDEACFVAVDFWGVGIESTGRARAVTGVDILSLLPTELALHILVLLCSHTYPTAHTVLTQSSLDPAADPFPALIACLAVSRNWKKLASDNSVWRALFTSRWGSINDKKAEDYLMRQQRSSRKKLGLQPHTSVYMKPREPSFHRRSSTVGGREMGIPSNIHKRLPPLPTEIEAEDFSSTSASVPLTLDWRNLFRERLELERRWNEATCVSSPTRSLRNSNLASSNSTNPSSDLHRSSVRNSGGVTDKWQPKVSKLSGHSDSVYCLEFTSQYIITGSRDWKIKVWSQKTGRCLGTFGRSGDDSEESGLTGHGGSVLCLKFFWDEGKDQESSENVDEELGLRRGVMFSGSSDCKVFVWDLYCSAKGMVRRRPSPWGPGKDWRVSQHETSPGDVEEDEAEVRARVKSVLLGHDGGVLDLRVDDKWIVSCSKDAAIRVWNRKTEVLHRTLRGHEGPVNAVGLEGGRVVSASGDGKMILWDIASGERLRTLDGHDRGLACIEFKDNLIVSGSNDCKIKIWSASTGECLRTLVGHEALVRALAFDPRSGLLVSASYDKTVRVWDVATGKTLREFRNSHTSHIFDVKFDAARIVSTSHDQKIVVLDFGQGIESTTLFV